MNENTNDDEFMMFVPKDIYVPDQFGEKRKPADFDSPTPVLYQNVNAAITNLLDEDYINFGKQFILKGYAFAGRGNKII